MRLAIGWLLGWLMVGEHTWADLLCAMQRDNKRLAKWCRGWDVGLWDVLVSCLVVNRCFPVPWFAVGEHTGSVYGTCWGVCCSV